MKRIDGEPMRIASFRELRSVRCINEKEKIAACNRWKCRASSTFSLSRLLFELIRNYAPEKMRRYSEFLFSILKE